MSFVVLELDTRAPALEVKGSTGTIAGQLLRVAYATDEPIAGAELVIGRRVVALRVSDAELQADLPADVPDGWASIRAWDDVGNVGLVVRAVELTGLTATPVDTSAAPAAGGPSGVALGRGEAPLPRPRQLSSRSTAVARTRGVVHAVAPGRVALVARSRGRVVAVDRARATLTIAARNRVSAAPTPTRSTVGGTSRATVVRRDGPNIEALLLLL